MYLKLTRLDNSPIWINAAFIVTVEPRKGGGSVVVPIGDGLDYDVRETTDQVMAMLGDVPAPAVVPVPAPKLLAPTPADVSPDTEPPKDEPPASAEAEPKPVKRTRRTKKAADGEAAPKTTRKPRAKKTAEKVAEAEPETPAAPEAEPPAAEPEPPAPAAPAELADAQVERLRKMMPRSMRKLWNTLVSQFKVTDAEAVIGFLQERGIIEVGPQDHIIWK